jgi:methylated-DNA-protein-cysteine methyltransferase-like protein
MNPPNNFKNNVEYIVARIPSGRVMTYGQIAALCGNARAARIVGGIAHYGNPTLPWHRVVNISGGLASGFPGGRQSQRRLLENEKIQVDDDFRVVLKELVWWPSQSL